MSDLVNVGVAELEVSSNSRVLASFGLGSCVAVAMYDPLKKIGGLAHIMLPESKGKSSEKSPGKFADIAVQCLHEGMLQAGARRNGIRCKIVGGSQMFETTEPRRKNDGSSSASHIGARNVAKVKEVLEELGVPLAGEDTGGNYGRTIRFDTYSGDVEVSSIHHGRTLI